MTKRYTAKSPPSTETELGGFGRTSKNKVTTINTFAVLVIRYPAAIVSCRMRDLKETDIGVSAGESTALSNFSCTVSFSSAT